MCLDLNREINQRKESRPEGLHRAKLTLTHFADNRLAKYNNREINQNKESGPEALQKAKLIVTRIIRPCTRNTKQQIRTNGEINHRNESAP